MSLEESEEFITVLTRLNAKTSDMESIGVSTSTDRLTSSDVAACCSGCDEIGLMALKRRVNDDESACAGFYRLYAMIVRLGHRNAWANSGKAIQGGQLRDLLKTCLFDYFGKHKCRTCKATGKVPIEKDSPLLRTCQTCSGERFRKRRDKERAIEMKVDAPEYSRIWKARHNEVMELLHRTLPDREFSAREHIRMRLSKH